MSSTDTRSGFRLPWNSDRSHDAHAENEPVGAVEEAIAEPVTSDVAWPDSDYSTRLGLTPTHQRPPEQAPEAPDAEVTAAETPAATENPASVEPASQEPAMIDTAPPAPAPVAPRKPSKLMVDLSAAIRATAEAARDQALTQLDADVAVVVAEIRSGSKEGESALKQRSDEDIAGIREWSKAEIARIKEETEGRIEARRVALAKEIDAHSAEIEVRVGAVEGLAASYRTDMAAYSDRLVTEDDPARLATMAETLPEPPALTGVVEADIADLPVANEPEAILAPVADEVEAALAPGAFGEPDPDPESQPVVEAQVEVEAIVEPEAPETVLEADAGSEAVAGPAAAEEPGPKASAETPSTWGSPTPWTTGDEFVAGPSAAATARAADDTGDDGPRWAAGETPDGFPASDESGDPVDRGAIMAALEAAAEAVVAAEAAAESADQAEAAADVAETAAELLVGRAGPDDEYDPEAQAAFSARVDAGGFDTESYTDRLASLMPSHAEGINDGEPRTTQVVVSGLVSVASIASFKRHLGRLPGVTAVGVASGPDGEFVFNVSHGSDVSFRDAVPTMPGFAARVTSTGDGVVMVSARDPEAEG